MTLLTLLTKEGTKEGQKCHEAVSNLGGSAEEVESESGDEQEQFQEVAEHTFSLPVQHGCVRACVCVSAEVHAALSKCCSWL